MKKNISSNNKVNIVFLNNIKYVENLKIYISDHFLLKTMMSIILQINLLDFCKKEKTKNG